MWKRYLPLFLVLLLWCLGFSLAAQQSGSDSDPMLQIKQSELNELISLIETLEQSNTDRLSELKMSAQLYNEREIYWQTFKSEMTRLRAENNLMAGLVLGLVSTTAVSVFLLFMLH